MRAGTATGWQAGAAEGYGEGSGGDGGPVRLCDELIDFVGEQTAVAGQLELMSELLGMSAVRIRADGPHPVERRGDFDADDAGAAQAIAELPAELASLGRAPHHLRFDGGEDLHAGAGELPAAVRLPEDVRQPRRLIGGQVLDGLAVLVEHLEDLNRVGEVGELNTHATTSCQPAPAICSSA